MPHANQVFVRKIQFSTRWIASWA